MKSILQTLILFIPILSLSQDFEMEKEQLAPYEMFSLQKKDSYEESWSHKNYLQNGLIVQNEQYFKGELRSRRKFIYDSLDKKIAEVWRFRIGEGKVNDTTRRFSNTYDEDGKLLRMEDSSGIIEQYSLFDDNGNPQLLERKSKNEDTLTLAPFKEIRHYNEGGKIKKEELHFYQYNADFEHLVLEKLINEYTYDKFGNVIEIKRSFQPAQELPIYSSGRRPLYAIENYSYEYNKDGLWKKMYWTIEGKRELLQKRSFKK